MTTIYELDARGFIIAEHGPGADLPRGAILTDVAPPVKRDKKPLFTRPCWDHARQEWVEGADVFLHGVKERVKEQIDRESSALIANLRSPDPIRNLEYDQKAAEARAFFVDSKTPTPMVDAEAAATGIDRVMLMRNIRTRDDAFRAQLARVTALRRAAKLKIEAADAEDVHTIAQQFRTDLAG